MTNPYWIKDRNKPVLRYVGCEREWRTPCKDLPPAAYVRWLGSGERRLCHGPAEAAYYFSLGYRVQLFKEAQNEVLGVWLGWVVQGVISPVKLYEQMTGNPTVVEPGKVVYD